MSKREVTKILFIGHDASLTGAPILLLNLLDLLSKLGKYKIDVLLVRSGPLDLKYKELFNVQILKPEDYGNEKNLLRRMINFLRYQMKLRKLKDDAHKFDIIFSNTIANGRVLKAVFRSKKIITYVHELESVIKFFQTTGDSIWSFALSSTFCVPSLAVMDNLVKNHSIEQNKISLLHYFFPFSNTPDFDKKRESEVFMRRYHIPEDSFMVLGMGVASFRKGFDLFMKISDKFQTSDKITFVWIGDFVDDEMRNKYINSSRKVIVTGYLPNKLENFLPFDIFLLTSIEDPYPLVVLEAAFVKLPSVCFEGSGGITDFVDNESGWVVPNFSTDQMALSIREAKTNREIAKRKGEVANGKVMSLHSDNIKIVREFDNVIQNVIA